MTNYALMPNYRNYWKEAGYVEEMTAIERAVAEGRADEIARYLPDRWIADIALFGAAAKIRGYRGVARRRHQNPGIGAALCRWEPEDRAATSVRRVC